MKNLKDIINEKLVINKNTKVESYKDIDYDNPEDICNIYKIFKNNSTFIPILLENKFIAVPIFCQI